MSVKATELRGHAAWQRSFAQRAPDGERQRRLALAAYIEELADKADGDELASALGARPPEI